MRFSVLGAPVLVACFALGACSDFKSDADGGVDAGGDANATGGDSGTSTGDGGNGADSGTIDGGGADTGVVVTDSGSTTDTETVVDSGAAGDGGCPASGCPIEVVVDNLNQATLVAVDTSNVYFGDEGTTTGNVYQCPKSGCATPIGLGPGYATGLGVDGTNVYWNDFSGGTVVRCTIGGCANQPTVIAPSQPSAEGVTFDGTNLYWASSGNVVTCVPPACTTRTTLATGQSTIVQMASASDVAFWITGGNLVDCGAGGCNMAPAKVSPAGGQSVVVKNGVAYFTSGNAVVSCPVGQGCTTPFTIGSSSQPYGLGTDGVDVYWLDGLDPYVYRCPVSGCTGSAAQFASSMYSQPGANVALDGEYAYWTVPAQVLRKHK